MKKIFVVLILVSGIFFLFWALMWFCYLKTSTQVEERFGALRPRWHLTERICLGLYTVIMAVSVYYFRQVSQQALGLINTRTVVENMVNNFKRRLPIVLEDGLILKQIWLDNDTVVFDYKFVEMSADSVRSNLARSNVMCLKQLSLSTLAAQSIKDSFFLNVCTANDIHIRYQYLEQYGQVIYAIRITPEEYRRARNLGTNFRCDSLSWQTALTQARQSLPEPFLDSFQLLDVQVNFQAQRLELTVQLPAEGELSQMGNAPLYRYMQTQKEQLAQHLCVSMSLCDKMNIFFRFKRPDGAEQATVVLPYQLF